MWLKWANDIFEGKSLMMTEFLWLGTPNSHQIQHWHLWALQEKKAGLDAWVWSKKRWNMPCLNCIFWPKKVGILGHWILRLASREHSWTIAPLNRRRRTAVTRNRSWKPPSRPRRKITKGSQALSACLSRYELLFSCTLRRNSVVHQLPMNGFFFKFPPNHSLKEVDWMFSTLSLLQC